MRKFSIKLRVTLWFTLMMVLIVAATLTFLISAGEYIELAGSKETLRRAVAEGFEELEWDDGRPDFDDLDTYIRGVYLSVYSETGELLYGRLPGGFDTALPFSDFGLRTVSGEDGEWMVYDESGSIERRMDVQIRGVMPASGNSAYRTMIRLSLIILPVIVMLAAFIGYQLTARAFRPIAQITASAGRIAGGEDLTERIPIREGNDEVQTLAQTFNAMLERLQNSFESERRFTSDAAHELRTPVAVIISQCEYAIEHAQTPGEAKNALFSILEQAKGMSAMTSQLLTLSRADMGRDTLQREELNLSELAEVVAAQMEEAAAEKGITIHTDIEPDLMLVGDETMLMRLLLNLTENGIKYGKPGGNLTVTLHRNGAHIDGTIADDGIGIAQEDLPKIWDRFYQADPSRNGGEHGVGLGLPMVKYIVSAHSGTITAQSTPGEGTVFFFTLPEKSGKL